MEIRKLVKAGEASHTLSLPKDWIDKNKLKKGDTLFVEERSDSELVITPKLREEKREKKEKEIRIDGKDIGSIQREITSAYVNNYNTIILAGKEISRKSKQVREKIHDFVALEVAEQTSERIIAKDLLNVKEISVESTIRRMDMIIRSIFNDSIEDNGKEIYESIVNRDSDLNRLYFLMLRLFKSSLSDPRISESLGIKPTEVMTLWQMTTNLENMGDTIKSICTILSKMQGKGKKGRSTDKGISSIYTEIKNSYEDVIKSYYNNDKELADDVASRRVGIFDSCTNYFEKHKQTDVAELMENFRELMTLVCNVARTVIDSE